MLNKTAIALSFGIALYFLPHVNHKMIFVPLVILSGFIPQLSSLRKTKSENSAVDKFFKNYLTCIIGSVILAFIYPIAALPFFLGYSFNLTFSAFSREGLMPFWPVSKRKTSGPIISGGKIDHTVFIMLVIIDVALLAKLFL